MYDHTCAECGRSLSDLNIKHGWIMVQVTFNHQARVHTLCRAKFEARPLEQQKERAA